MGCEVDGDMTHQSGDRVELFWIRIRTFSQLAYSKSDKDQRTLSGYGYYLNRIGYFITRWFFDFEIAIMAKRDECGK